MNFFQPKNFLAVIGIALFILFVLDVLKNGNAANNILKTTVQGTNSIFQTLKS